jgi:NAD(P)-dependent dehydrogenase (short-subunit alcohol dehydrogenase family)
VATINAKYPERAIAIRVDVSNEEQVAAAVQTTVEKFGRLDYAINSAGLVVAGDAVELIKDTPVSDYERTQSVDAKGIFICMKHQLKQMVQQDVPGYPRASRGVIVNLASRASLEGVVSISSKQGVRSILLMTVIQHSQGSAHIAQPSMRFSAFQE